MGENLLLPPCCSPAHSPPAWPVSLRDVSGDAVLEHLGTETDCLTSDMETYASLSKIDAVVDVWEPKVEGLAPAVEVYALL